MMERMGFSRLLQDAQTRGRAVAAFNVYNRVTIGAALSASETSQQPVILALGEKYLRHFTPDEFVQNVQSMSTCYPGAMFAIHLDHAKRLDTCMAAIDAGFDSVMIDASTETIEENIRLTKQIVTLAHQHRVAVEAELGGIGVGQASHEFSDGLEQLTDPADAELFVQSTRVDCLAVSIGTVHGFYQGEPHIDIARLQAIQAVVDIPLVLHGGSGTPVDVIHETIRYGIAKINVNTEVSAKAVQAVQTAISNNPKIHLSELDVYAASAAKDVMLDYIKRFDTQLSPGMIVGEQP